MTVRRAGLAAVACLALACLALASYRLDSPQASSLDRAVTACKRTADRLEAAYNPFEPGKGHRGLLGGVVLEGGMM